MLGQSPVIAQPGQAQRPAPTLRNPKDPARFLRDFHKPQAQNLYNVFLHNPALCSSKFI